MFDDDSTDSDSSSVMCLNITEMATKEINKYFQEKRTNINEDPLAFWRVQKNKFPLLSKLARIFLSPPPSSSASEREFKISKSLQKDRIKLLPKNLELLLFLKCNLRSINYCKDLREVSKTLSLQIQFRLYSRRSRIWKMILI